MNSHPNTIETTAVVHITNVHDHCVKPCGRRTIILIFVVIYVDGVQTVVYVTYSLSVQLLLFHTPLCTYGLSVWLLLFHTLLVPMVSVYRLVVCTTVYSVYTSIQPVHQYTAFTPALYTSIHLVHQYTVCAPVYSLCTSIQSVHQYTVCAPVYSLCTSIQSVHQYTVCTPVYIILCILFYLIRNSLHWRMWIDFRDNSAITQ